MKKDHPLRCQDDASVDNDVVNVVDKPDEYSAANVNVTV